jgi:hypothetical protein
MRFSGDVFSHYGHHMQIGGGDLPPSSPEGIGTLGADYTIENGRYRSRRFMRADKLAPASGRAR